MEEEETESLLLSITIPITHADMTKKEKTVEQNVKNRPDEKGPCGIARPEIV